MTNNIVDRSANAFGKTIVIEWGGNTAVFDNITMGNIVETVGRNTRIDEATDKFQRI